MLARNDKGLSRESVTLGERLRIDAEGSLLRLQGEIDLATAPKLAAALREALCAPGDGLVLDFAKVTFMDAAGLSVLVQAQKQLDRDGQNSITVRSPPRLVRRLFEITGLDEVFSIDG